MAKYDVAFKLAVVKAHENGEGGYKSLAKKFNIPSASTVKKWVKVHQALGKEGLERKRKNKTYTVQFKLDVLNYKLRTGKSYQEVANTFGMSELSLIANWYKAWTQKGVDGLSKSRGRPSMSKKKRNQSNFKRTSG